jgi:hypothetical protein
MDGQRIDQIVEEIRHDGYQVTRARKTDDAELVIQTGAAVGCVLLDWGKRRPQGKMAGLVSLIRKRGLDMPQAYRICPSTERANLLDHPERLRLMEISGRAVTSLRDAPLHVDRRAGSGTDRRSRS